MRISKWKGGLVGFAALGLVAGASTVGHAATCGDANNNNNVDVGDSVQLLQFVAGLNPGTSYCGGAGPNQCLDLNQDGAVDVADLVILVNKVAGNQPTFFCTGQGNLLPCGSSLSGTINSSVELPGGCDSFVDGTVLISPGVVVTVKPGATVKGKKNSTNGTPSVLVFLRGSKINAAGTAANPIIFTSDQAPGSRSIGDWGGVVLNGRAPVNCPGGECVAEGLTGITFGGTDPNDSSGILTFARLEFSGVELSPDNELNILTQNGIGRGTTINHVQCNFGFDDNFEWFGGTVNEKYLVSSAPGDDGLDWQLGYTGSVQHAIVIQAATNSDNNGRHGFEGDNNENGFDFLPRSNPKFCNVTLLGTAYQTPVLGTGKNGRRAMLLRRGTAGKLQNILAGEFTEAGIQLDDNATAAVACQDATHLKADSPTAPNLSLRNVIMWDNGLFNGVASTLQAKGSATTPCNPAQFLALLAASNNVSPATPGDPGAAPAKVGGGPIRNDPYPTSATTTQYIPAVGSSADGSGTSCVSLDPSWFDATTYLGAFKPGATAPGDDFNSDWMNGAWVGFEQN